MFLPGEVRLIINVEKVSLNFMEPKKKDKYNSFLMIQTFFT